MMVDFLQFLCNYILAGFLLGWLQIQLLNRNQKAAANALAFVK